MLKKTIKFTDFNGKECSEDLYFHISKTTILTSSNAIYNEIMSIGLELQERGKFLEDVEENDIDKSDPFNKNSQLVADSIRMIARLLDRLVDLAYGIKSEDGSKFIKNQQVREDFKNSAAYDAFVEQLIENQEEMIDFVNQLLASYN